MTLPMPPCTCVPYEPNNPECAAHGVCSCDDPDSWGACPLHVACDEGCKARRYPLPGPEVLAAYLHWRSHRYMHGCSHGN
jgi:hypothetical protein